MSEPTDENVPPKNLEETTAIDDLGYEDLEDDDNFEEEEYESCCAEDYDACC